MAKAIDSNMVSVDRNNCITVVMVNWFSCSLISRLLRNLAAKAAQPDQLHYIVIDNTNGQDDQMEQLRLEHKAVRVKPLDSGNLRGSWAHANGLNYATPRIETAYTLIIDPDVHIFKREWDVFLIDALKNEKAIAIGAPYPSWKLGKYHDFPSPPFSFFDTSAISELGMDWTPFPHHPLQKLKNFGLRQIVRMGLICTRRRLATWPQLKKISGHLESIIGVCAPDTGWLIAANARKRGEKSVLFSEVEARNSLFQRHSCATDLNILATEFELYQYGNEPILTHKYSTSGYLWRTKQGKDSEYWLDVIERIENCMEYMGSRRYAP